MVTRQQVKDSGNRTDRLIPLDPTEVEEHRLILKQGGSRSATRKRKSAGHDNQDARRKRACVTADANEGIQIESEWPERLTSAEKDEIMREFVEGTSNDAVKHIECSFCGRLDVALNMHLIPTDKLDITLLKDTVERLKNISGQQHIPAFRQSTIENGKYMACSYCRRDIRYNKFAGLPVRSYANGTWTGEVPEELSCLTYMEEQCIAQARMTSCMFKLEPGPTGQYAARGNICIFPQEPGPLATVLPVPLNKLYDEVCVILVASPTVPITMEMLTKTPLLVQRSKIVEALQWLHLHNPLYSDISMDAVEANARQYPEHGIPIPMECIIRTEHSGGEGDSYGKTGPSGDVADPREAHTAEAVLPTSTVVDADHVEATYQSRKLSALKQLKRGMAKFVKIPMGTTPIPTFQNPDVYTYLWPTLFPYSIGTMEQQLLMTDSGGGFRKIDLKAHIAHLLQSGPNTRFQTHLSFIFVTVNILQRRETSWNAKLAVTKSWFQDISTQLEKMTEDDIQSFANKLKENPYARPDSEGEKAAYNLVKYANIVAEHVPGSMGEIQKMQEEMFSIVHTHGLPHLFLTLNPSDTNNPIAQVLAGQDIDLDKLFDELSPGAEKLERGKTVAANPVAGVLFFNKTVNMLLDTLLGTTRSNKRGIFGELSAYYGVVEAQGRGSLHIHLLIWLRHGLSPLEIKEKCDNNPTWKNRLLEWYDDIVSQCMPENMHRYQRKEGEYHSFPVMTWPIGLHVDSDEFSQDLRNVIESASMVHTHSDTCFKHLAVNVRHLHDNDKDCRFQLPRPLEEKTYMDKDGGIVFKCNDGRVNRHNKLIMVAERCNMDIKPIGGGALAMAMFQYMGNYTVKFMLDTAFVFTALCASIKTLGKNPPKDLNDEVDEGERNRLLMIKTANQLIGKQELSGQQVATMLLRLPTNYTNLSFPRFYWVNFLRALAPEIFTTQATTPSDGRRTDEEERDVERESETTLNGQDRTEYPHENTTIAGPVTEETEGYVVLTPEMILRPVSEGNRRGLFDDFFL